LGDNLGALREGGSVDMYYDTTFLVNWPKHLGGGSVYLELEGSMLLAPLLTT
jgi:hypothetical protein